MGPMMFKLLLLVIMNFTWAGMYAISETGEKVFLRDNGTWNKVKGNEADHVDLSNDQLKLNVKFKNRSILEMERRNELLPKGMSDKELARQISKLPQSKFVLYVAPESVSKASPRVLLVTLKDSRGHVLYSKKHNDNRSYESGVAGWLTLTEMTFNTVLKGKYILYIKDVTKNHTMEYTLHAD
jgi:hypothetical protein